jgi:hypothetical protein
VEICLREVLTSLASLVPIRLPRLHVLFQGRTFLLQIIDSVILFLEGSLQVSNEVLLDILQLIQSVLMCFFLHGVISSLFQVDPLDALQVGVLVVFGLVLGFFFELVHMRSVYLLVGEVGRFE